MVKKILRVILFLLVIIVVLIGCIIMKLADENLDGYPPVDLSEKYELDARDVDWNNVIIKKKDEFLTNKEKISKQYEEKMAYAIAEHVKLYFILKEKQIIGIKNDSYICLNLTNDKIEFQTKDEKAFQKHLQKKHRITNIKWIDPQEYVDNFGGTDEEF